MKKLIFLLALFFISSLKAQNSCKHYNYDSADQEEELLKINSYFKEFFESPKYKNQPKSIKSDLLDFTNSIQNRIKKDFENNMLVFDPETNAYFNKIIDALFEANPQLVRTDYHFYISRENFPNAFAYMNGYIVLNLDLLSKFENEGDIAFIIGHEIAHRYFHHSENKYIEKLNIFYSDSTQSKIKKLKKTKYNQYQELHKFYQEITLNSRLHSREFESQSDSMGLEILKNTIYSPYNAVKALEQLDSCDNQKYSRKLNFSEIFKFKHFELTDDKYQEDKVELGFFAKNTSKLEFDSIKNNLYRTHPECSKRIALLKDYLKDNKSNKSLTATAGTPEEYQIFKQNIDDLLLRSNYFLNDFTQGLYFNLQKIKINEDDAFAQALLALKFYQLHMDRKNFTFGKKVSISVNQDNEQLKELNTILNNLSAEDLKNISYGFLSRFIDKIQTDCEFQLYVATYLNKEFENIEDYLKNKEDYLQLYPKGKYIDLIKK